MTKPLRFCLAGTGYWARTVHAPALASTEGIEFAAVWGRNSHAVAELAASYQVMAHHDLSAFLAGIDAVAFAMPPDVQAPLAIRAARAGRHLLLESRSPLPRRTPMPSPTRSSRPRSPPLSSSPRGSRPTCGPGWPRSPPPAAGRGDARSGWARPCSRTAPYNTHWGRDKGGLWDLAPHLISLLWASLGPVHSVTAQAGLADVTHLILHHRTGVTSTVTVTLNAPEDAEFAELYLWGPAGSSVAPAETQHPVTPLRTALTELAANARTGQASHPCDVQFGREIARRLSQAQHQIASPSSHRTRGQRVGQRRAR